MGEVVELVPVDEGDDERIFAEFERGKGLRALAREFGRPMATIEAVLDRQLPQFDAKNQLLAFKRELHRLQALTDTFFTIAQRDKCRDSAHLVARLNERVAAMRGWTSINVHMDPYVAEVAQQPTQYEKITEAIMRICGEQPPAEREAHDLVRKVGGEKAVALLSAGYDGDDDAASDDDGPDDGPSDLASAKHGIVG